MLQHTVRRIATALAFLTLTLVATLAYAADTEPTSEGLVEQGFDAVAQGNWWTLAGVVFSGLFLAARTYGPWKKLLGGDDELSKAQRDWRGYVGIAVLVVTGMAGSALMAHGGDAFNKDLVLAIVKTLAMAQLTYATGKKGLAPLLEGKPGDGKSASGELGGP